MNQGLTFEREALDTIEDCKKAAARSSVTETAGSVCLLSGRSRQFPPGIDDALSTHFLLWHMWEAFKETAPEEFTLYPLVYSAKKQSPIAKSQKAYLNDLLKYHRIEMNIRIEDMTRSEASRMIDKIILQYGRIPGRERKEREKRI